MMHELGRGIVDVQRNFALPTTDLDFRDSGSRGHRSRKTEEKLRPTVHGALGPDPSSVPVNDTMNDGQTNARAFELFITVQAIKGTE
jgi:hypothetical protein